jgi:hypothetical protein
MLLKPALAGPCPIRVGRKDTVNLKECMSSLVRFGMPRINMPLLFEDNNTEEVLVIKL